METIDDDTDKHGIQFVKSKDSKLASDIGIFSFPALVYYETGVPIMYDGKCFLEHTVIQLISDIIINKHLYIYFSVYNTKINMINDTKIVIVSFFGL